MFAYCRNTPVSRVDISGTVDTYSKDQDGKILSPEELESRNKDGGGKGLSNTVRQGGLLPKDYYVGKHAPKYSTPNSSYTNYSYNTYTNSYERSTAYYDYAGRQVLRIDWTNHGRSNHGNPHVHRYTYNSVYRDGTEMRLD